MGNHKMIISGIRVYQLHLPLIKPYWLSGGRLKFESLDSTIVRIDTDVGITGWGEGCPWGDTYLPAFGKGIRAVLALLAPQLIGHNPLQLDNINRIMDTALPGHPYGKSPIDIACWDILGQTSGLSVVDLLGGRATGPVPIASSVSTATPEEMLNTIKGYRATGYCVHSAKVGADVTLDIERIKFLHAHRAADESIFFDVNRAWLPNQAITVMNSVRELPVWFEQPCETLDECKQVRNQTSHPICIDEGLQGYSDLLHIHRESISEIVNIKINRVGGLSKAKRIRDFCLETGLAMLVMETGGTVLADTAAVHLAQSIPAERMLGTWLCHELLSHDMALGAGARNNQGHTAVPKVSGIGVAPDYASLGDPIAVYE